MRSLTFQQAFKAKYSTMVERWTIETFSRFPKDTKEVFDAHKELNAALSVIEKVATPEVKRMVAVELTSYLLDILDKEGK